MATKIAELCCSLKSSSCATFFLRSSVSKIICCCSFCPCRCIFKILSSFFPLSFRLCSNICFSASIIAEAFVCAISLSSSDRALRNSTCIERILFLYTCSIVIDFSKSCFSFCNASFVASSFSSLICLSISRVLLNIFAYSFSYSSALSIESLMIILVRLACRSM